MAFNPFHHFRRYSKVVFAILAIICMLTFVMSSGMGRGDFFQQMTDWVTKTTKGFCSGSKVKYQTGYQPNPDPCASTTSTNATTTG